MQWTTSLSLDLVKQLNGCSVLSPNSTVHYCLTNSKHFTFPANSLPEQLHSQREIVELMANYMEQNLMEVWAKLFFVSGIIWLSWLIEWLPVLTFVLNWMRLINDEAQTSSISVGQWIIKTSCDLNYFHTSGWGSALWGASLGSSSSAAPVGKDWTCSCHALQQWHSSGLEKTHLYIISHYK